MAKNSLKVALIGNPNTGKTSIFNALTGMNQRVGNYPGITVERKQGVFQLSGTLSVDLWDLPGSYSLNANSLDEDVVLKLLMDSNNPEFPDVAVVVTEVENLKRNLLIFTQVKELGIPTILVINMSDRMESRGITLDIPYLEKVLKTKIALVSSRKKTGITALKTMIEHHATLSLEACFQLSSVEPDYFNDLHRACPDQLLYRVWLMISQRVNLGKLHRNEPSVRPFVKSDTELKRLQQREIVGRYLFLDGVLKTGYAVDRSKSADFQRKLDRILMHKVFGYLIFFGILLLLFQAIFSWSTIPMDFIDTCFAQLSTFVKQHLEPGVLTDLISDGLIPGLGGVLIFVPQIAFLFLFISVLEESGYMSRVVFLMDKLMRRFGLSGKSIVPLISGTACAIPAIMATRNIENWKERLITILVTPFTTCSARLPVYTILIALVIPSQLIGGVFNLKGLTLMALYLMGFGMALLSAYILNLVLKVEKKSYFVVEMPSYKVPMWNNIVINVVEKTKAFVFGAGKIILSLSVILWFLGTHGPGADFKNAEQIVDNQLENRVVTGEKENLVAAYKLENSYIGLLGKGIEPLIRPLGYDWKIGIAVLSSFAAREVFVGTLATIYSVGSHSDEEATIKQRMSEEVDPLTGRKVFNLATGVSLLLFYAFAMQCISTLAITKRETNSWKWPMTQLLFMSVFAYSVSFMAYQLLK